MGVFKFSKVDFTILNMKKNKSCEKVKSDKFFPFAFFILS